MIIKKYRESSLFHFELVLHSAVSEHNKFTNKENEIDQIISIAVDGLKSKLNDYLTSVPDVGVKP